MYKWPVFLYLMKRFILLIAVLFIVLNSWAQVHVRGYYRKDGTYVQPHYRSSPDGNPYNNYSYPGNYNPYTGRIAPGNPYTYLYNYYLRGSSYGYSGVNASTQKACSETEFNELLSFNYSALTSNESYNLVNQYSNKLGFAYFVDDHRYNIYDLNGNQVCYVIYKKRNHRKYNVFTPDGNLIYSNQNHLPVWFWVYSGVSVGLLVVGAVVLAQ